MKYEHKDLVEIGYKWLSSNTSCGVIIKEIANTSCREIPDVIGFGSGGFSVLIECKTSRSDFLSDKKKAFRRDPRMGMGSQRYYLCPNGVVNVCDLPSGWGLIWVNEKGKARCIFKPFDGPTRKQSLINEKNFLAEHGLLYSCLRRLTIHGKLHLIYPEYRNINDSKTCDTIKQPTDHYMEE